MALNPIKPFCYETYHYKTEEFAHWLINYVETNKIHGLTGWIAWFTNFGWGKCLNGGPAWERGVVNRARYHDKLKSVLNNSDNHLISVVNEIIVDWHGMGKDSSYPLKFAPGIRKALHLLRNEIENSAWIPKQIDDLDTGGTIASMSKIYQMIDPHKWTIYDSRVATGLACLVRRFWSGCGEENDSDLIRFCVPSRKIPGWKKPVGFPSCSGSRQGCLGFIYASWLLRQVAEIMRSDSKYGIPPTVEIQNTIQQLDGNWQVYHLEMALWMLGDKEF